MLKHDAVSTTGDAVRSPSRLLQRPRLLRECRLGLAERCLFEPLEDRRLLAVDYDLAGVSYDIAQGALTASEYFRVDWEVTNQGASASCTYRVGIYAWRENNPGDTLYIYGHGTEYPALAPGASYGRTQYLILPKNAPGYAGWWDDHGAGDYVIGMKILHDGGDTDPANNGNYQFGKDKDIVTVDIIDDTPPTAQMITDVIGNEAFGQNAITVEARFADDVHLDYLSSGVFRITGPGAFETTINGAQTIWDDDYHKSGIGRIEVSAYGFWPDNEWGPDANGTYTLSVEPNSVKDYTGNAMAGGVIGQFFVDIEPMNPTADLADPVNGGEIYLAEIDGRNYIDVTFNDLSGTGLKTYTITDYNPEFALRYADGTVITHDGAADLVSGTTYRYEFYSSSLLQPGEVTVEFLAGTFRDNMNVDNLGELESFTIVADPAFGPTAALVYPLDGGVEPVFELKDRHYIDVRFNDLSGAGLDTATILDAQAEFTATGDAALGLSFSGAPQSLGNGVYRYSYYGQTKCGDIEINFIAGSFADSAGNVNDAATESFYVDGPDMYGAYFDVLELQASPGGQINIAATVRNDHLVAYESFYVRFYLSSDPHIAHGEDYLLAVTTVPGMNPDSDLNIQKQASLPAAGHALYNGDGVYYIGMIIDDENIAPETNEANNANQGTYLDREDIEILAAVVPDKPDLVAAFGTIPMNTIIYQDQRDRVEVTVTNLTEVRATGKIAIQLFLSPDKVLDDHNHLGADTKAGGSVGLNLNLGELETTTFSVFFISPSYLTAGQHYLLAKVDYANAIDEANEDNNIVASSEVFEWQRKVGEEGAKQLVLEDKSGTLVTFKMSGGGSAVIDPTDDGFDIAMTGTNARSSLKLAARGGGYSLHDITVDGDLKDINGRGALLTGSIDIAGSVTKIQLGDVADDHTIAIGGSVSAAPARIQFNAVTDLVLTSDTPIKQLKARSWRDTDAIPDRIAAPWPGVLQGNGDFKADLLLGGEGAAGATLGKVKITGDLTGGTWSVTGGASNISAGAAASDWSAAFTGDVGKVRFSGDVAGDLSARSIKTLDIRGDLQEALIRLNPTVDASAVASTVLGNLKVAGWMNGSEVRAFGNIGKATVGGMRDSNLFAGVRNYVTGLPALVGEFSHESSIARILIRGIAGAEHCYLNSNIAAQLLAQVQVRHCETDNGGTAFGVAARSLGRFQRFETTGRFTWPNKSEPDGPAPDGDFVVRLI